MGILVNTTISITVLLLLFLNMDLSFPTCSATKVYKNSNCAHCGDKSTKYMLTPMPESFRSLSLSLSLSNQVEPQKDHPSRKRKGEIFGVPTG